MVNARAVARRKFALCFWVARHSCLRGELMLMRAASDASRACRAGSDRLDRQKRIESQYMSAQVDHSRLAGGTLSVGYTVSRSALRCTPPVAFVRAPGRARRPLAMEAELHAGVQLVF